jgi:hypothetical protein
LVTFTPLNSGADVLPLIWFESRVECVIGFDLLTRRTIHCPIIKPQRGSREAASWGKEGTHEVTLGALSSNRLHCRSVGPVFPDKRKGSVNPPSCDYHLSKEKAWKSCVPVTGLWSRDVWFPTPSGKLRRVLCTSSTNLRVCWNTWAYSQSMPIPETVPSWELSWLQKIELEL